MHVYKVRPGIIIIYYRIIIVMAAYVYTLFAIVETHRGRHIVCMCRNGTRLQQERSEHNIIIYIGIYNAYRY